MRHLHIDWCEGTVGDGAADSASEGESRVQLQTRELGWLIGLDSLLDGIELCRARRRWGGGSCARHLESASCEVVVKRLRDGREDQREWRWQWQWEGKLMIVVWMECRIKFCQVPLELRELSGQ
jgi:hypothetical protein